MRALVRRMTGEQRKLFLSLGTNVLTRIPGVVGLLWFLPLLRFGLGTDDYSSLLGWLALGTGASFLAGGFNTVGRRLIGEAYANEDRVGEANGFVSLIVSNVIALGFALVIIGTYWWLRGGSVTLLVVCALPALMAFLNMLDTVRAAYNEHYVTALLQFGLQISIYTIGFLVPAASHTLIPAALVLLGHYIIASIVTGGLICARRPYLFTGLPVSTWRIAREGTMLAVAEGSLMATISLSVVWLQASASAATSAWFATLVRLFQTFLVPVILLLYPLSSYIRILWNRKTIAQQRAMMKVTLGLGLGYGAMIAVAMVIASQLYIQGMLHLPPPEQYFQLVPIFILFGAIVAFRAYSAIAFVVLEETSHLSMWTTAAVGVAVAFAAAASLITAPLAVVNVYALVAGLSITIVVIWSAARFIVAPQPIR